MSGDGLPADAGPQEGYFCKALDDMRGGAERA